MQFDSRNADRITAFVLFALGSAMGYGGLVMDRLEVRQIHPASIPGLVPMLLGGALMICAALLAFANRQTETQTPESSGGSWGGFFVAAVLSGIYALVLVGWLPFMAATAIYMAAFAGYFFWRDGSHERPLHTAVSVIAFSIVMSVGISVLFRYGFLVRLP